jgi:hypothetical protein
MAHILERGCRLVLTPIVIVPLALATGCARPWQRFDATEAGFSVEIPTKPERLVRRIATSAGETERRTYCSLAGLNDSTRAQEVIFNLSAAPTGYCVHEFAWPEGTPARSDESILAEVRAGYLGGLEEPKLIRQQPIARRPGATHGYEDVVQARLGSHPYWLRSRFYYVGGRAYLAFVLGDSRRQVMSAAAEHFFSSFEIVSAP